MKVNVKRWNDLCNHAYLYADWSEEAQEIIKELGNFTRNEGKDYFFNAATMTGPSGKKRIGWVHIEVGWDAYTGELYSKSDIVYGRPYQKSNIVASKLPQEDISWFVDYYARVISVLYDHKLLIP